jgi:pyrroloquinoline quinone biosynthesis protein D
MVNGAPPAGGKRGQGVTAELSGKPRHADGFTGREVGEDYVILDRAGDRFYQLNGTAREIYLLCDGSRTADDIARAMTRSYTVTLETSRRDTAKTIAELLRAGILTHS